MGLSQKRPPVRYSYLGNFFAEVLSHLGIFFRQLLYFFPQNAELAHVGPVHRANLQIVLLSQLVPQAYQGIFIVDHSVFVLLYYDWKEKVFTKGRPLMKSVPHDVWIVALLGKAIANLLDLQVGDPISIWTQSVHQIDLKLQFVKCHNRAIDNALEPVLDVLYFPIDSLYEFFTADVDVVLSK